MCIRDRNRFVHWACGLYHDELHGDNLLYDVCVFYDSKYQKDEIHTGGSAFGDICRNCSKCTACIGDVCRVMIF